VQKGFAVHLHDRYRRAIAAALLLAGPLGAASRRRLSHYLDADRPVRDGDGGMAGCQLPVGRRLGAFGVFYYSDVLAVAATGVTNPLLLVPLVATGFIGGCSVGANAAPA